MIPGFVNNSPASFNENGNNFLLNQLDTRYSYPMLAPVNPIVRNTTIGPKEEYSGGYSELLKIPLQMNDPNNMEQLRSQNILITPYNRIKYSNNC